MCIHATLVLNIISGRLGLHTGNICFVISTFFYTGHHKSRLFQCLTALVIIALCLATALAVLVWYAKIPSPVDTQQVYHDIVYSPFPSINQWLFSGVEVQVNENGGLYPHKVTLCQKECPLKTQTKSLAFCGVCRTTRTVNCFALVTNQVSSDADAQYVSEYMLKNSNMTFRIDGSSNIQELIHLCITTDKDTCQKVVRTKLSQVEMQHNCKQVIPFDKSYNYTQTFVTPNDSYYCAVWLLNGINQWLNYTSISSIETYNLTDFNNLCETLPQTSIVTHALSGPPTQNLCTVLKVERTRDLFGSNITVITSAVKTLTHTASIVLIAIDVCLIIVLLLVIAICATLFFVCCKMRPLSTWVLPRDIQ